MTFLESLQAAGLPVISADESGACDLGSMTPDQQQTFADVVLQYFNPSAYALVLDDRANRQQLRTDYQTTIDTLLQIENTASPTNAQVISAVKFLAKTLRLLIKLIVKLI